MKSLLRHSGRFLAGTQYFCNSGPRPEARRGDGSGGISYKDEWSDIDLAVVSDAFEGERFRDRNMIRRITLAIISDLEPLPYRPEDFTPDDPFVREVLETGVRVA
jgi:hypothetical protein